MLEIGKRYEWSIYGTPGFSFHPDLPEKWKRNGLFTGEYRPNGNAVFVCRNGDVWQVPEANVRLYKKGRRK